MTVLIFIIPPPSTVIIGPRADNDSTDVHYSTPLVLSLCAHGRIIPITQYPLQWLTTYIIQFLIYSLLSARLYYNVHLYASVGIEIRADIEIRAMSGIHL